MTRDGRFTPSCVSSFPSRTITVALEALTSLPRTPLLGALMQQPSRRKDNGMISPLPERVEADLESLQLLAERPVREAPLNLSNYSHHRLMSIRESTELDIIPAVIGRLAAVPLLRNPLESALRTMDDALGIWSDDPETGRQALLQADADFHIALWNIADHGLITYAYHLAALKLLPAGHSPTIPFEIRSATVDLHHTIYNYLRAGDQSGAENAVRAHYETAWEYLLNYDKDLHMDPGGGKITALKTKSRKALTESESLPNSRGPDIPTDQQSGGDDSSSVYDKYLGELVAGFEKNRIYRAPKGSVNLELAEVDASRGEEFSRRFPKHTVQDLERLYANLWVGVVPVKVGEGFAFEEVRVLTSAPDRASLELLIEQMKKEFPDVHINKRRIRSSDTSLDLQG